MYNRAKNKNKKPVKLKLWNSEPTSKRLAKRPSTWLWNLSQFEALYLCHLRAPTQNPFLESEFQQTPVCFAIMKRKRVNNSSNKKCSRTCQIVPVFTDSVWFRCFLFFKICYFFVNRSQNHTITSNNRDASKINLYQILLSIFF